MGDFDEVERLQAGIRAWLLRSARSGRHELRGIAAPAVLRLLCAAAFGLALAGDPAPAAARMGVLASVAAVLARVLGEAATRVRSVSSGPAADLLAAACAIAGQSLTREQWAGYAGTQPFRQVCPAR